MSGGFCLVNVWLFSANFKAKAVVVPRDAGRWKYSGPGGRVFYPWNCLSIMIRKSRSTLRWFIIVLKLFMDNASPHCLNSGPPKLNQSLRAQKRPIVVPSPMQSSVTTEDHCSWCFIMKEKPQRHSIMVLHTIPYDGQQQCCAGFVPILLPPNHTRYPSPSPSLFF